MRKIFLSFLLFSHFIADASNFLNNKAIVPLAGLAVCLAGYKMSTFENMLSPVKDTILTDTFGVVNDIGRSVYFLRTKQGIQTFIFRFGENIAVRSNVGYWLSRDLPINPLLKMSFFDTVIDFIARKDYEKETYYSHNNEIKFFDSPFGLPFELIEKTLTRGLYIHFDLYGYRPSARFPDCLILIASNLVSNRVSYHLDLFASLDQEGRSDECDDYPNEQKRYDIKARIFFLLAKIILASFIDFMVFNSLSFWHAFVNR